MTAILQIIAFAVLIALCPAISNAWFDETHLAIAKAAGYAKWFNAAAADITKEKMGNKEENLGLCLSTRAFEIDAHLLTLHRSNS